MNNSNPSAWTPADTDAPAWPNHAPTGRDIESVDQLIGGIPALSRTLYCRDRFHRECSGQGEYFDRQFSRSFTDPCHCFCHSEPPEVGQEVFLTLITLSAEGKSVLAHINAENSYDPSGGTGVVLKISTTSTETLYQVNIPGVSSPQWFTRDDLLPVETRR